MDRAAGLEANAGGDYGDHLPTSRAVAGLGFVRISHV